MGINFIIQQHFIFYFTYFNTNNNSSAPCTGTYTTLTAGSAPYFSFICYTSPTNYTTITTFTEGDANKVAFTADYDFKIVANTGQNVMVQVKRVF